MTILKSVVLRHAGCYELTVTILDSFEHHIQPRHPG